MPWMCLNFCGENIKGDLQSIGEHKEALTGISWEDYEIGPNGLMERENLTSVNQKIREFSLQNFPMISSGSLEQVRQLLDVSDAFISDAVSKSVAFGYFGYNIDFEPNDTATNEDAQNYANFLTDFADALHSVGKQLTVDIADWNPFWNFSLLAQTTVDRLITMDTYDSNYTNYVLLLEQEVQIFGVDKLGIGFDCSDYNQTTEELQNRFNILAEYNIQEIDIWVMPIPDFWWPFIEKFKNGGFGRNKDSD